MGFTFSDYIIILISVFVGTMSLLLSTDKIYKFYIGLVFGFLIFLILNLETKVLELTNAGKDITDAGFLLKNKNFVLTFSSSMIPIFGLFSVFNENEAKNKPIISFGFGLFITFFIVSIFSFIVVNTNTQIDYLSGIFGLVQNSNIINFFKNNNYYIFYFITFIIFWRFIITLLAKVSLILGKSSLDYVKKIKIPKK